ncbi:MULTISPECIES: DUF6864 domain-containing function [Aeromonas]|uniref:DUF6864 domain-containing function n=1 Tax=Aeromonas TaxID=642 RepID=UPI001C22462D|nr:MULTISPECIES: hypothetical protein [Aeromonas]QXB98371.1 hypothetical protein I6L48_15265 [Aeromonas sp. FDAARGOS 1418]
MKVTMGSLQRIHDANVLVPKNESIWLEFRAYDWDMKLNFKFIADEDQYPDGHFEFEGREDHAVATLYNWNNSLGRTLKTPFELGSTDERKVYAMFACYSIGEVTKFEIQVYIDLEDTHE